MIAKRHAAGLNRFLCEEDAPTTTEYALLLIFTALVVTGAAIAMGGSLRNLFEASAPMIGNPVPPPP